MTTKSPFPLPEEFNAASYFVDRHIAEGRAAKVAIEADGYRNAKVVRQGENGIWHAKAMRGTIEVLLAVDSSGNVTTGD